MWTALYYRYQLRVRYRNKAACQDQLGWDPNVDSLKLCVRKKCDNLFGQKPELHDLWEGCVWYVEWMNAVDNPTFMYKEVLCPQELVDMYYSSMHPKP